MGNNQIVEGDDIQNMVDFLSQFSKSWPPYPQQFSIPKEIRAVWINKDYLCMRSKKSMPLLYGSFPKKIHVGDRFNGVVISRKRKKGLKFPYRCHRTSQLIFPPNNLSGRIMFNKSLRGDPILKKGELRTGEVHRFEITGLDIAHHAFYCVSLAYVFTPDNILDNLVNCNYKAR